MYESDVPCWSNLGQRCPTFNSQSPAFWLVLLAVAAAFFFDIRSAVRSWTDGFSRMLSSSSMPETILTPHEYRGYCLTTGMDFGQGMRGPEQFLADCQLALNAFLSDYHINEILSSMRATVSLSSSNLKFRRPLHFMESYTIQTKVVWWDNNHIYLKQKLTQDHTLCAVNITRLTVLGAEPQEIFSALPVCSCRPPLPPEIASWLVCIQVVNREMTMSGHL